MKKKKVFKMIAHPTIVQKFEAYDTKDALEKCVVITDMWKNLGATVIGFDCREVDEPLSKEVEEPHNVLLGDYPPFNKNVIVKTFNGYDIKWLDKNLKWHKQDANLKEYDMGEEINSVIWWKTLEKLV